MPFYLELDEIKNALFNCYGRKSPSPNGFTLTFFQDCWDVIKEVLMRVFSKFFYNGIVNACTIAYFICPIPKKEGSLRLKKFKPISLVTSLYEILAKVLAKRLREILSNTISSSKSAFIRGHEILDIVLVANEVVDDNRSNGLESLVFKVDFEKAYDHLNWEFLDFELESNSFGCKWRK